MNYFKTKGLVLGKTFFGDDDLIFDLLCQDGERLSFFVRGARKIRNNYAGSIQIGNFVDIQFRMGRNFCYPKEINLQTDLIFDFCSESIEKMNFFADIIQICKHISKDFKSHLVYTEALKAFINSQSRSADMLNEVYVNFLDAVLVDLGICTDVLDSITGEKIDDGEEFYYHHQTNGVFLRENKPKMVDIPLVKKDFVFLKLYLQQIFRLNVNRHVRLKF